MFDTSRSSVRSSAALRKEYSLMAFTVRSAASSAHTNTIHRDVTRRTLYTGPRRDKTQITTPHDNARFDVQRQHRTLEQALAT